MKEKINEIYTEKEFLDWLLLHKKRVIEIRKEKDLKRKENLIGFNYPSYQLLSDIESFREGIALRSLYLDIKLLKVSAYKFYTVPYFKNETDNEPPPEPEYYI